MSKIAKLLAVSTLSLTLLPFVAWSEEGDEGAGPEDRPQMTREQRRAHWENLSEEEKRAMRAQMRAKREERRARWEAMTPEEREAKKAEMRKRMESMTPEQREAMRQRRANRGHHGGKKGGKKNEGS